MSERDWLWFGQAGHFVGSNSCRFHLHTHVADYCVSTVGEYFPRSGRSEMATLGHERFYETMVFPLTPDGSDIESWGELDGDGYTNRAKANAGHVAMCERWAAK